MLERQCSPSRLWELIVDKKELNLTFPGTEYPPMVAPSRGVILDMPFVTGG